MGKVRRIVPGAWTGAVADRPPLKDLPYCYEEGVTNSMLSDWQDCRYRSKLLRAGWRASESTESLEFGSLFHYLLEHGYKAVIAGEIRSWQDAIEAFEPMLAKYLALYETRRNSSSLAPQVMELLAAQAEGVWQQYCRHWHHDFKQAKTHWLELEGTFDEVWNPPSGSGPHRLRGKRDGMREAKTGLILFESKTKGQWDDKTLSLGLAYDRQLHFYQLANALTMARLGMKKRITAALYNVIRRPQIAPGKNGDLKAYVQRISADAEARPDFYFWRADLEFEQPAIDEFARELQHMLIDFRACSRGEIPEYRNRSACLGRKFNCRYIAACAKRHMRNYTQDGRLFPELVDDVE